jgi:transcriptional regulator with XRE-family HTH domain
MILTAFSLDTESLFRLITESPKQLEELDMAAQATLTKPPGGRVAGKSKAKIQMQAVPAIARRSDLAGSDNGLDLNSLGGRLAYARLREEVTQEQLAEAADKCRGTIVAYERNKIMPPIPIIEALAKVLKVSPSFLAFGEHGVKSVGDMNAAESTVNVDEITFGRDGHYTSGTFAMPRSLAESYVESVRSLKVYVLGHNADAFGLRQDTRLFVDTSVQSISNEFDTYVIEANGGMEVIRIAPSFAKSNKVVVEGSRGDKQEVAPKDLNILGAVVSTLRPQ